MTAHETHHACGAGSIAAPIETPVSEADRRPSRANSISHWSFDRLAGQINACDDRGNLIMAIAADPMFGRRLAAAFDTPPTQPQSPPHATSALAAQVTASRPPAPSSPYAAHQPWNDVRVAA
ncbi:hypothetical protein [Roseateles sp. BYS96W]|uniref:Uncharacterized protein n=1 Tax=Pelomonas nitida TaxID=3299027 RepID=A0ABW7GC11_9BURK